MTTRPTRTSAQDLGLSAALVVMWSSGFVGAELGERAGTQAATLLGWRFTALAALLLVVGTARGVRLSRIDWRRQVPVGLLCQVGYLYLVFEGVLHGVPGGVAALIAGLQPLLVATVAGRLLGEHTDLRGWAGLVLGMAGVVVVVAGDLHGSGVPVWAYVLPGAGMLCLASGTVLERRTRPRGSLLETLLAQSVLCAVAFQAVALSTGELRPPADPDFWVAVAWLLVLSSLGGYGAYVLVARRRGATVVSTLLYLTPPTSLIWTWLMFGDPLTRTTLLGLVISALGVAMVLRRRGRLPARETSRGTLPGRLRRSTHRPPPDGDPGADDQGGRIGTGAQ